MSSADIENKILENDQQIEPLLKAMDLIFENIQSEMVPVAKKWITEEVERSLTYNWEVAEQLGPEGMRSLHTDLHLILQEVPQKVDDCFDQKETWPHHKPYTLKGSSGIYLKVVEDKFKEVILSTGKLLLRYKLLTEKAGSNPKWITDPTGTFVFDPRGKLPLPTAQQNEAYSKLFTEYSGLSAQRNIYSEELQQTKIKEQWGKLHSG